ncbi:J517_1871 family lipoprotein [Acinetobacter seifertii]|uniref:J517_1871 family lipoprotein n=1 Tax=Acinetobacter seifertii TaxID=1530123 RepID=UPI00124C95B3|nr:J517_1871 family lipoprotein [Acinetobacter seifertii]
MKKIILISLAALFTGCVTPATQMMNNKFSEIVPNMTQTNGIWTTSIGPGLSTIKLDRDGSGVLCEDTSGHVFLNKIKFFNNTIYVQNGMTLEVKRLDKNILEVRTTLSASNLNMLYKSDYDLKQASLKCAKEM